MTLSAEELAALINEVDMINIRKKEICEKLGIRDTITFEDLSCELTAFIRERLFYEWQLTRNGAKV